MYRAVGHADAVLVVHHQRPEDVDRCRWPRPSRRGGDMHVRRMPIQGTAARDGHINRLPAPPGRPPACWSARESRHRRRPATQARTRFRRRQATTRHEGPSSKPQPFISPSGSTLSSSPVSACCGRSQSIVIQSQSGYLSTSSPPKQRSPSTSSGCCILITSSLSSMLGRTRKRTRPRPGPGDKVVGIRRKPAWPRTRSPLAAMHRCPR